MRKILLTSVKLILITNIFLGTFILLAPATNAASTWCCTATKSSSTKAYDGAATVDECKKKAQKDYLPGEMDRDYTFSYTENGSISSDGKSCVAKVDKKDDLGASVPKFGNPLDNPKIAVKIPGFSEFNNITCSQTTNSNGELVEECSIPWLADYIAALYKYGIGVILILAVITMMIAGVIWITAAGNESKVSDAKKWISGSLFGILIALSSYMILNTLNPALTQLSPIKLASIGKTDLQELTIVDPEDLTPANTTELSQGSHGTGQGQYKLPIYYQGSYSEPKCMGSSACGPTSLSMILNYYGINKTPPEVAIDSQKRGHWSCSGWNDGLGGFKDMLDYYKTNLKTKSGSSFEDIKELLKYGPVIASIRNSGSKTRGDPSRCPFTGKGHYVVFTGYSNGTFYTNDPNAGNRGKTEAILESSFIGKCYINAGVMAIYK